MHTNQRDDEGVFTKPTHNNSHKAPSIKDLSNNIMVGLKRSMKCEDLLTMTKSQQGKQEEEVHTIVIRSESLLVSQFVHLRASSKRPRHGTKSPATAALEGLESSASWQMVAAMGV